MNEHKTSIRYGSDKLPLFLPAHTAPLTVTDPAKTISEKIFRERLQQFLFEQRLDLSNPVIVVADKTRLCGYPKYLPVLVDELMRHGMPPSSVSFIIAYGTHPPQSKDESLAAYGAIFDQYPFIHHSSDDTDCFAERGVTERNTPIRFRKDLLSASAIITFGAVSHHYFAGYGGGRKLIFPGCGEKEAIYKNHSLFLSQSEGKLSPGCQPGNLKDNPLSEDLFEIESHCPAHLSIHGLLNSKGEVCDLLLGEGRQLFEEACSRHGRSCEVNSGQFDLVVASAGGFPKDINFIQAHKAIHNSAMFVKDGGMLVVYCECRDSIGSVTFLPWFQKESFSAAFKSLATRYEGNGGTALSMMTKLKRIHIGLVTSLEKEILRTIGVTRWNHNQVVDYLATLGQDATIGYIANASLLVKKQ